MIKCAYCETETRSNSGMAQHVIKDHSDKWAGNVKASFPAGFDAGTPEPRMMKTKRGSERFPTVCPFCGHNSRRPQGLAAHLKGNHPDKWKGNMGDTLGLGPSRKWSKDERGRAQRNKLRVNSNHLEDPRGFINCCPNCGTQLAPYYLAAGAMQRRADK